VSDLATWLFAQYDADERRAGDLHDRRTCDMYSYDPKCCDCDYPDELRDDLAAKRRIVEMHRDQNPRGHGCPEIESDGSVYHDGWCRSGTGGCATLRLLALPYAGREGYDPAWAPSNS
jgi:hypothetical protein